MDKEFVLMHTRYNNVFVKRHKSVDKNKCYNVYSWIQKLYESFRLKKGDYVNVTVFNKIILFKIFKMNAPVIIVWFNFNKGYIRLMNPNVYDSATKLWYGYHREDVRIFYKKVYEEYPQIIEEKGSFLFNKNKEQ